MGGALHDKALSSLYSDQDLKQKLFGLFKSKGLGKNVSETLWTDLVIQFGYLVKEGKYKEEGKLAAYLKNLGHYLVLNHFRSERKNTLDLNAEPLEIIQEFEALPIFKKELKSLLSDQLNKLGETCKKILLLWAAKYSMQEIQSQLGIVSPEATRKRKHSCYKKLLSNIESNPSIKKELMQYL